MSAGNRSLIRTPSHSTVPLDRSRGSPWSKYRRAQLRNGRGGVNPSTRLAWKRSRPARSTPAPPRTVSKRRALHFAPDGTPCLLQVKAQHRRQVRRRIATPMSRHGTECVRGARWAGPGAIRSATRRLQSLGNRGRGPRAAHDTREGRLQRDAYRGHTDSFEGCEARLSRGTI